MSLMANAKKCDICERYYDIYKEVEVEPWGKYTGCQLRFEYCSSNSIRVIELCPECMKKVHTLFIGIAEEKKNV